MSGAVSSIIKQEKCNHLDVRDEFFDSMREDYTGFDNWFCERCQKNERDCLVIRDGKKIKGLCIYKDENETAGSYGMDGRIVKICTFKLLQNRRRLGKILLEKVLCICLEKKADYVYATAFKKNPVCQFLEHFGFDMQPFIKEDTGESIFVKKLCP